MNYAFEIVRSIDGYMRKKEFVWKMANSVSRCFNFVSYIDEIK